MARASVAQFYFAWGDFSKADARPNVARQGREASPAFPMYGGRLNGRRLNADFSKLGRAGHRRLMPMISANETRIDAAEISGAWLSDHEDDRDRPAHSAAT